MLSFKQQKQTSLPPVIMFDARLRENVSLILINLTFSTGLKWNNYIKLLAASPQGKFVLYEGSEGFSNLSPTYTSTNPCILLLYIC